MEQKGKLFLFKTILGLLYRFFLSDKISGACMQPSDGINDLRGGRRVSRFWNS
jgi:hypothetical protein